MGMKIQKKYEAFMFTVSIVKYTGHITRVGLSSLMLYHTREKLRHDLRVCADSHLSFISRYIVEYSQSKSNLNYPHSIALVTA